MLDARQECRATERYKGRQARQECRATEHHIVKKRLSCIFTEHVHLQTKDKNMLDNAHLTIRVVEGKPNHDVIYSLIEGALLIPPTEEAREAKQNKAFRVS